jgi:hypothetical protein
VLMKSGSMTGSVAASFVGDLGTLSVLDSDKNSTGNDQ